LLTRAFVRSDKEVMSFDAMGAVAETGEYYASVFLTSLGSEAKNRRAARAVAHAVNTLLGARVCAAHTVMLPGQALNPLRSEALQLIVSPREDSLWGVASKNQFQWPHPPLEHKTFLNYHEINKYSDRLESVEIALSLPKGTLALIGELGPVFERGPLQMDGDFAPPVETMVSSVIVGLKRCQPKQTVPCACCRSHNKGVCFRGDETIIALGLRIAALPGV
jgi:hypothetical protein